MRVGEDGERLAVVTDQYGLERILLQGQGDTETHAQTNTQTYTGKQESIKQFI